jgi:hypothetical protein
MDNNDNDLNNDKKCMSKAKSCNNDSEANPRAKAERLKRKSFYVNEAVRSLDLALGRLKKSKLVNGEYGSNSQTISTRQGAMDMFLDAHPNFSFNQSMDNASLMSMNFSHYELMRNLSESNCNSEAAFSGTTGGRFANPTEVSVKDEHLERYFRSVEMWRNYKMDVPKQPFKLPEK